MKLLWLFLKTVGVTLAFLLVMLIISLGALAYYSYHQLSLFTTAAQITPLQLKQTIQSGFTEQVVRQDNFKYFLILGTDSLATRGNIPPLTDSIMLISLNLTNGQVNILPLPRDLWLEEYQTKINALYAYGPDHYPDQPYRFPQEIISEITQLPIHHTIVLSLDRTAQLIDLLGGIDVEITEGFVDTQFPRPDVDVRTTRDPKLLYETVEFQPGVENMNGERALKYMRSRHSTGQQGDDLARSSRQQTVIIGLLKKFQNKNLWLDPSRLGYLYRWYLNNFDQYFSVTQGIATLKTLWPVRRQLMQTGPSITTHQLSIYPSDKNGSLIHPPLSSQYQKQWVFVIKDQVKFQTEVRDKLRYTTL